MDKSKFAIDPLTPLSILIIFQFDKPMIGHHDHFMEYHVQNVIWIYISLAIA
jgi:hypothetical protein